MSTFDWALTDTLILLLLLVLVSMPLAITVWNMRGLLRLDYRLHPIGLPDRVTRLVQTAESHYYSQQRASRVVETFQDVLAIVAPQLVYRFNSSVGRMRMKPKTIESIMSYHCFAATSPVSTTIGPPVCQPNIQAHSRPPYPSPCLSQPWA